MRKKLILGLFCISILSFSQSITQGPDPGEIFFFGYHLQSEALFYSTDYGKTAICVDSTIYGGVEADLTKGGIYYSDGNNLYYSPNYGVANSWQFQNGSVGAQINSGRIAGEIFNNIGSHSINFGQNFISHNLNGFFGLLRESEIDIEPGVGYALVYKYTVPDTFYLLNSFDNFDNLQVVNKLNYPNGNYFSISHTTVSGSLYILNVYKGDLLFSNDYGTSLNLMNTIHTSNIIEIGSTGGWSDNEIFIYQSFAINVGESVHNYILYSTDFGATFELFHPFSHGPEPLLANFSTAIPEGPKPHTVEFCNYSIGDVQIYEWDFENDGIIDSYEKSPTFTYQDSGYYSVKLSITGADSTNTFLRENYIHVKNIVGLQEHNAESSLLCFPNPFNETLYIEIDNESFMTGNEIKILEMGGNCIKHLPLTSNKATWNGMKADGAKAERGTYFVLYNSANPIIKKILFIH